MSAKKTVVAKKAAKPATTTFKKGDKVSFTGWADGAEAPEGAEEVEEGMTGIVRSVSKDTVDVEFTVDGEALLVPLDPSEMELASNKATKPAAKVAAKKAAKSKAPAEEEEEEEVEEEEVEEEEAEEEAEEAEQSLGELADEDDTSPEGKAAGKTLTARGKAVGVDVMEYATWVKAEKAIIKAEDKAAKAEAKANKPAKAPKVVAEIIVSADVKKAMGSDPCAAALKLVQTAERSYFTLGGILAVIDRDKSHEALTDAKGKPLYEGFEGFGQFCEEYLGVTYRKAKFLIAINQSFSAAGVTAEQLASIGWAKAKDLTSIVQAEPDKAESWLEKAESLTREKLISAIKTRLIKIGAKRHGNATDVTTVTCSFRVFEDQGKTVKSAIEKAKELIDSGDATPTDSEAFYHIVSEWLSFQE